MYPPVGGVPSDRGPLSGGAPYKRYYPFKELVPHGKWQFTRGLVKISLETN